MVVIDGEHGRFYEPLKILDTITYQPPNTDPPRDNMKTQPG